MIFNKVDIWSAGNYGSVEDSSRYYYYYYYYYYYNYNYCIIILIYLDVLLAHFVS